MIILHALSFLDLFGFSLGGCFIDRIYDLLFDVLHFIANILVFYLIKGVLIIYVIDFGNLLLFSRTLVLRCSVRLLFLDRRFRVNVFILARKEELLFGLMVLYLDFFIVELFLIVTGLVFIFRD